LLAILAREPNERFVVFADSHATLQSLDAAVQSAGRPSLHYAGDRAKKLQIVRRFRATPGSVLIADKSLAEGSDLQFAHLLVVYDMPWNPFALEQMIGRLYRIGQTSAVEIHAIVSSNGLDHELFELYDKSLRMFDRQVGELDAILGQLDDNFDFAHEVWNAVASSRATSDIHANFKTLRDAIDSALQELLDEERFLQAMGLA
jgi:superfamily II DNA/RNA helicase